MDGTLLRALPKMLWALWVNDQNRAAKLHLEFDILNSTPVNAKITNGNGNEKTVLREFLSPNKLYTLDAGYREYKLFQEITDANSSVIARLQDNVGLVVSPINAPLRCYVSTFPAGLTKKSWLNTSKN